jgi:leucyl/phenylalanyl-tRNA---protein transferase
MIPPISKYSYTFPDPRLASDEGLLAYGGDLTPNRLLTAYRKGIFPWYNAEDPILWWSPDPRLVLYPGHFKMSKSFRRILRHQAFRVTFDGDFEGVIGHCGSVPRPGQRGTWLIPEMQEAYIELYGMGFGHSVEVYQEESLVGGLYGLAMGGLFFGESMFSLVSHASKVAFKALSDVLALRGYDLIDCQVKNEHLMRMGAALVSRESFLDQLEAGLRKPTQQGSWHNWEWEYREDD